MANGTARKDDAPKGRKRNLTAYVEQDLDDEIRAMVDDIKRRVDLNFSIAAFAEEALRAHLPVFRRKYNGGRPWLPSKNGLTRIPRGRPHSR